MYRHLTCAFLSNGKGQYLMLKRSNSKAIAPDLWTGLGGHIEAKEHMDPYQACKREIFEESGLGENEIFNLNLKYIMISRKDRGEIRQHYIFFGTTARTDVIPNTEGTLHWIDEKNILGLDMPRTLQEVILHHSNDGDNIANQVWIGMLSQTEAGSGITWGTA